MLKILAPEGKARQGKANHLMHGAGTNPGGQVRGVGGDNSQSCWQGGIPVILFGVPSLGLRAQDQLGRKRNDSADASCQSSTQSKLGGKESLINKELGVFGLAGEH